MAYPPLAENVRFFCRFNGTVGDTSSTDESLFGNHPNFRGGCELNDDQNWCGDTYVNTDAVGVGAFSIDQILGSTISANGDFFIETFYRINEAGGNDSLISVGADTADDKFFELRYSGGGFLTFRYSLDGINFLSETIGGLNSTGWYYLVLQRSGTKYSCWVDRITGTPEMPNPDTATLRINEFEPSPLYATSAAAIYFGAEGPTLSRSNEGGFSITRVVLGEPYIDETDGNIPVPLCSELAAFSVCRPVAQSNFITSKILFLDEDYSQDFSYFFSSPGGRPVTYSSSGLPPGLGVASSNGVVSVAIVAPATEGQIYTSSIIATTTCGSTTGEIEFTVGTNVTAGGDSFNFIHSGG